MLDWIVFNGTDYLHEMDLALNNLQRLICHKTQPTKPNHSPVHPNRSLIIRCSLISYHRHVRVWHYKFFCPLIYLFRCNNKYACKCKKICMSAYVLIKTNELLVWIHQLGKNLKASDLSQGWSEGSFFNSYYTEVYGRALLHFLDCSTLLLILNFNLVLSTAASSTIFWVSGMTRLGIEPRSPGPLMNTVLIKPQGRFTKVYRKKKSIKESKSSLSFVILKKSLRCYNKSWYISRP